MMDRIREDEIKRQAAAAVLCMFVKRRKSAQAKDIQKALERGNQYMSVNDFEKAMKSFKACCRPTAEFRCRAQAQLIGVTQGDRANESVSVGNDYQVRDT